MTPEASRRGQALALWCAPIFTVLVVVGWLGLAHFWLPAPADLGAEATKTFFVETHRAGMVLGNSLLIVACALLVVVSIQFGLQLAELEGPRPLWSITSATCGVLIALIVFLNAGFWIGAAYRPGAHPDVIVALNDVAWLGFLLGWVFLCLQMVATAIVALSEDGPDRMIPAWASKASLIGAVLLVCAGGPAFTHGGPFAYHGLLAFYMPMAIWGLWLDAHAFFLRRRLVSEAASMADKQVGRAPSLPGMLRP